MKKLSLFCAFVFAASFSFTSVQASANTPACTILRIPVCGLLDGKLQTFRNECVANEEYGAEIAYRGQCATACDDNVHVHNWSHVKACGVDADGNEQTYRNICEVNDNPNVWIKHVHACEIEMPSSSEEETTNHNWETIEWNELFPTYNDSFGPVPSRHHFRHHRDAIRESLRKRINWWRDQ